jgi:hypothetical protein
MPDLWQTALGRPEIAVRRIASSQFGIGTVIFAGHGRYILGLLLIVIGIVGFLVNAKFR